jgi:hypothetical protein
MRGEAISLGERKRWLSRECVWLRRVENVGATAWDRERAAETLRALLPELVEVTAAAEKRHRKVLAVGLGIFAGFLAFWLMHPLLLRLVAAQ